MKLFQHVHNGQHTAINLERVTYVQYKDTSNSVSVHFGEEHYVRLVFDSRQDAAENCQYLINEMEREPL